MPQATQAISILIADDNLDDRRLLARAMQEVGIPNKIDFVNDGEALLDFLRLSPKGPGGPSLPGLVLLDLNMPRLDGREALKAIRSDPRLRLIPVVILSTSNYKQDVLDCYHLGANAVMVKPLGYAQFLNMVTMIGRYWLEQVQLPAQFD
jgi:two-component system response regulator